MQARNLIRQTASIAAVLFGATLLPAQTPPSAGATSKVGVLNVRQAIVSTAEGKQASSELQAQFQPRQTELENLNNQVNDLRKKLDACQSTCSDEEKTRLTNEGNRLTRVLNRKQSELQEDVNAAQAEVVDRLGRKMLDVVDRYARENGLVAVLDTSAQNSSILYASSNIDITQQIIKLYDQAYPVKAGASAPGSAPKPAPVRPAPTKPPTPPPSKP